MSLSIFSFGNPPSSAKPETRTEAPPVQPAPEPKQPTVVVAAAVADEPQKMVLDLENLTPETLAAFFPSERSLVSAK
jgi:hypothetical protein